MFSVAKLVGNSDAVQKTGPTSHKQHNYDLMKTTTKSCVVFSQRMYSSEAYLNQLFLENDFVSISTVRTLGR